jgi:hypothetical protein
MIRWQDFIAQPGKAMTPLLSVLNATPEMSGKKQIILVAREAGAISDADAALLIRAYQLGAA